MLSVINLSQIPLLHYLSIISQLKNNWSKKKNHNTSAFWPMSMFTKVSKSVIPCQYSCFSIWIMSGSLMRKLVAGKWWWWITLFDRLACLKNIYYVGSILVRRKQSYQPSKSTSFFNGSLLPTSCIDGYMVFERVQN